MNDGKIYPKKTIFGGMHLFVTILNVFFQSWYYLCNILIIKTILTNFQILKNQNRILLIFFRILLTTLKNEIESYCIILKNQNRILTYNF